MLGRQLERYSEPKLLSSVHQSVKDLCVQFQPKPVPPPATSSHLSGDNSGSRSRSMYKVILCRYFEKDGYCPWGDGCMYAHGKEELKPPVPLPEVS